MREREFIESELSRCNKCGYCMQSCPVYRTSRREAQVARGRIQTLRAIIEGKTALAQETLEPFFDCLLCGACTVDCFGAVETKELMVRAREAYCAEYGRPFILRYIFRKLLPDPERLARVVRLASLGKRTGLSTVARRLGLLRWLSPSLDAADALVASVPRVFLRERLAEMGFARVEENGITLYRLEPESAKRPSILYFIGCATNFDLPRTGEAAIRLLAAADCRVTIAPNNCCGLPPWSYGDLEAAEELARRNVELLTGLDFDLLVTECGSCSAFLKEYADLLPDDTRAAELVSRTRDLTELLADLSLPNPTNTGTTITYHDPCHLARQQKIVEAPRKLLVDAGGYELVEMAESDWCCGGAGSYNLTHPEMSRDILARKMSRITDTGADVIATACPACMIQLSFGSRCHAPHRPVRHLVELLAERQGIELTF